MTVADDPAAFVNARLDEGGLPPRVTDALRSLAAIWDYHPAYRQEWAPGVPRA
jgi:hypothetical protein